MDRQRMYTSSLRSFEDTNRTLNEIQLQFQNKVGHLPHTKQQILQYCKQNHLPFKYNQILVWWPTRTNPQTKPFQQAVNAFVDHSSAFSVPYLVCTGYIRLHIAPQLIQIIHIVPLDIIREIYKFSGDIGTNKPIFLKRSYSVNPTSEVFCIDMNDDQVKFTIHPHNTSSFADGRTSNIAHINAMDIHLKYPSILDELLRSNAVAPSPHLRLNCVFECGGHALLSRMSHYYASVVMVIYQHNELQNALRKVGSLSTSKYVQCFIKKIKDFPAIGSCSVAYDVDVGLIVACNRESGGMSGAGRIMYARCYWSTPRPSNREQKYFILIEDEDTLKWNEIENSNSYKQYSAILIVNQSKDLFVCGDSGVGMFNFKTQKWSKLPHMLCGVTNGNYYTPVLCYDEYKHRVYCVHGFRSVRVEYMFTYFDLDTLEWKRETPLPRRDEHIFLWMDRDRQLSAKVKDMVFVYDFTRNEWIDNETKSKIFQQFKDVEYIF